MPKCKKAFQDLKDVFIKIPILAHFILRQQLYLKTNFLDYVNIGVLSQIGDNNLLHPVVFYLSKLTL